MVKKRKVYLAKKCPICLIEEATTEAALKSDVPNPLFRNLHLLCLSHDAFLPVCFKIRALSKGLTPKMDAYCCLAENLSVAGMGIKNERFQLLLLSIYCTNS